MEERSYCREVRTEKTQGGTRIAGTAAVFYDGTRSTEFDLREGVRERILPGAFDNALARPDDVRALKNHDSSQILGRTKAGTLELSIDERGLHYSTTPSDTLLYRDTLTEIARGDLDGSSFQFVVTDQNLIREGDDIIREIRDVQLYDVGPVTFPAYPATAAQVRAIRQQLEGGETRHFNVRQEARLNALSAEIADQLRELSDLTPDEPTG